jgi:hypothetical protein
VHVRPSQLDTSETDAPSPKPVHHTGPRHHHNDGVEFPRPGQFCEPTPDLRDGQELNRHLRGHASAVEFPLERIHGDRVVHEQDATGSEWFAATDHDLPVDQAIIDTREQRSVGNRHARSFSPEARAGRRS